MRDLTPGFPEFHLAPTTPRANRGKPASDLYSCQCPSTEPCSPVFVYVTQSLKKRFPSLGPLGPCESDSESRLPLGACRHRTKKPSRTAAPGGLLPCHPGPRTGRPPDSGAWGKRKTSLFSVVPFCRAVGDVNRLALANFV